MMVIKKGEDKLKVFSFARDANISNTYFSVLLLYFMIQLDAYDGKPAGEGLVIPIPIIYRTSTLNIFEDKREFSPSIICFHNKKGD